MPADRVYFWQSIAPGATVGVYVHGYGEGEVAVYSTEIINPNILERGWEVINLTQGIMHVHVDLTMAREAWVQNRTTPPRDLFLSVSLTELFDQVQP
jgi:hypothetical protein